MGSAGRATPTLSRWPNSPSMRTRSRRSRSTRTVSPRSGLGNTPGMPGASRRHPSPSWPASRKAGAAGGRLRLWVLDGASAATDVGGLQATAAPGSLFQAASQFNCLESPGPYVTPVAQYFHDRTQGPRARSRHFLGRCCATMPRRGATANDSSRQTPTNSICSPAYSARRWRGCRAAIYGRNVRDPRNWSLRSSEISS